MPRKILDLVEMACPHLPPPDPAWPTPIWPSNLVSTLARLPHASQVVCVITAAEMALALIPDLIEPSPPRERFIDRCALALEAAWGWVRKKRKAFGATDSASNMGDGAAAAPLFYEDEFIHWSSTPDLDVPILTHAAQACACAAWATRPSRLPNDAARGIVNALRVWEVWEGVIDQHTTFYERWWARVRCRLAVAYPGQGVVSGRVGAPIPFTVAQQEEYVAVMDTRDTYAVGYLPAFSKQRLLALQIGNLKHFVETHNNISHISWVGVEEARRHQGIGRQLLARLEHELALRGVEWVVLEASASQPKFQAPLEAWYRSQGYTEIPEAVEMHTLKFQVMCKRLMPGERWPRS